MAVWSLAVFQGTSTYKMEQDPLTKYQLSSKTMIHVGEFLEFCLTVILIFMKTTLEQQTAKADGPFL